MHRKTMEQGGNKKKNQMVWNSLPHFFIEALWHEGSYKIMASSLQRLRSGRASQQPEEMTSNAKKSEARICNMGKQILSIKER